MERKYKFTTVNYSNIETYTKFEHELTDTEKNILMIELLSAFENNTKENQKIFISMLLVEMIAIIGKKNVENILNENRN